MEQADPITLYTSDFCGHAWAVEQLLAAHEIPVAVYNIDSDPAARQQLKEINDGYASVPTLLFADGTKLVEPSFSRLRQKLGLSRTGLMDTLRMILDR